MLHIDFDKHGVKVGDRGAVLEYPPERVSDDQFRRSFGMCAERFLREQLGLEMAIGDVRWSLVQAEGVCDYAQAKPGPVTYLLGEDAPPKAILKAPDAAWHSPVLWIDSSERNMHLNFRFGLSLVEEAVKGFRIRFRFREALMNEIVSRMHFYGARPGMIAFREAAQRVANGKEAEGSGI